MCMSEEIKTQVSQAMDSASESGTEKESENVSSPDVKKEQESEDKTQEEPKEEKSPEGEDTEEKSSEEKEPQDKTEDKSEEKPEKESKEEVKDVDDKDYLSQIKNLNKAIAIERDEKSRLREDLESVKPFVDKMKTAFNPEEEEQEEEEPKPMTKDELEEWYSNKESEKQKQVEEKKLKETIDSQVDEMSKKWDGESGKPKYDDQEVIQWQRDNNKLYLMPEEAFTLMKRDEIIDWETKQVVSKGKKPVSSEKSSGGSTQHNPESVKPKTEQEVRNAALEALNSVDIE